MPVGHSKSDARVLIDAGQGTRWSSNSQTPASMKFSGGLQFRAQ